MARGSRRAGRVARPAAAEEAASPTALTAPLFPSPSVEWDPKYSPQEAALFKTKEGSLLPAGWWKFKDGRIAVPGTPALAVDRRFHQRTHLGRTALESTLGWYFYVPRLPSISRAVCEWCQVCARNTPRQGLCAPPGVQSVGGTPSEEPEVDR